MLGYQNNVLRVNLNGNKISNEPLNMEWAKKYLGAKGLGIKYMYEEQKAGVDPLSAENKFILMTGPLTGTVVANSGKLAIISKSPATGTILDCSIGGHIALALKYAGYDAAIFEGALNEPGYVYIENDKIKIMDAADLWGKGSHETEDLLIERHGREAKVLSIGPAGENLLGMACINSDYYRQAGRGGIGAVMGSKKIKAIVIKGTKGVKIPNMNEGLKRIHEILRDNVVTDDNSWVFDEGTATLVEACNVGGILPRNNFSDATFEEWENIASEKIQANRFGKKGCGSCALGCGNFTKIGKAICEGPEYETLALGGPNCGISDLETVVKFNQICDDLGVDTISMGATISYAMEMTEKGMYDFGIRFGENDNLLKYTEMIARKEGIGAELSMGSKKLAEKYGGLNFAIQTKGLEFPGYEPRGSWAMGLAYAVSDRGACHMRSYPAAVEVYEGEMDPYTIEGKGKLVYDLAVYNAVKFSAVICDFWALDIPMLAEVLNIVTGENFTEEDMNTIGVRVMNIARLFNQREGFDRKNDTLPRRMFDEVLKSGPAKGQKIPEDGFNKMLTEYYGLLGWDENGKIPEAKLAQFDL